MKNLVIVLKRSFVVGLIGGAMGTVGVAVALTSDRPMPAVTLDEQITATGSYLAGRHAQQTDDWPAAAEFMGAPSAGRSAREAAGWST